MLRAENITREFIRKSAGTNVFTAVSDVSAELSDNSLTVVTGRSGSGKSTLLNILSGLLSPDKGKVFIDDIDIWSLDDDKLARFRNERFGIIPQGQSAIFSLTVYENIMLPASLYGRNVPEGRAEELMEKMQITHLKDAMPRELSGGEMRRMAIARALINSPDVIFADEPTGDLDDENTAIVFSLLKEVSKSAAVFLVTHENSALEYADEIYRMDAGVLYPV